MHNSALYLIQRPNEWSRNADLAQPSFPSIQCLCLKPGLGYRNYEKEARMTSVSCSTGGSVLHCCLTYRQVRLDLCHYPSKPSTAPSEIMKLPQADCIGCSSAVSTLKWHTLILTIHTIGASEGPSEEARAWQEDLKPPAILTMES